MPSACDKSFDSAPCAIGSENGSGNRTSKNGCRWSRGEPLHRAALALNAKRPKEAQRIAEEILRRDPRHARALHILGFALLIQGRAEAAVAPLEAAARGRHDPEIETRLALALSQIGRRDEALSRLKRASKRQPPYAPAFHGLGSLLFAMERYDEAIETLRRGVAVAPMMPEMSTQLGNVSSKAEKIWGRKDRLRSGAIDFAGLLRRAVRHGESSLCDRPEPSRRRLFSPLPGEPARR